jgi:glycerate 2-kinase
VRRAGKVTARAALGVLFDAAIAALEPRRLVRRLLARERERLAPVLAAGRRRGLLIVGAGKGAAAIAAALEAELGPLVAGGLVIVPPGYEHPLRCVRLRRASHPVPDRRSVAATRALLAVIARAPRRPVLVIVTGGASSLLELPAPGLTLADTRRTHALLLGSGATIGEMNTVRTHLSAVKGGGLAARLGARPAAAIVLSDVPGDDPAVIGSGPTVRCRTTAADAARILRAYDLEGRLPARVRRHLARRARRRTAAPPALPTVLLAGNATACAAAARAARVSGLGTIVRLRAPVVGETAQAARRIAARLHALVRAGAPDAVLVAGGETTVRLSPGRHRGRGGRNQELALEVARRLAGERRWTLLCAGSDGIDGPTDAAGAFVDGRTAARAARAGWSVERALARHDVHPLLEAIGALHRPGPTGTNVADLVLALVRRSPVAAPRGRVIEATGV